MPSARSLPAISLRVFVALGIVFGVLRAGEFESWANPKAKLEISSRLTQAPGGMTITPSGSIILSLHQFQNSKVRVVEITPSGEVHSFPRASMNTPDAAGALKLDSVLGLQSDKKGVVWMLDNARRGETTPKLVAWDTKNDELEKVIYLPQPATIATSFVNDLALDPEEPFIYIADPAGGEDAAIIVVDTQTGLARRVLQGHYSVIPEGKDLLIDGKPIYSKRIDGTKVQPFGGVNPIAVDRKGDWVYYGPMDSKVLYRIPTADLQDRTLPPAELASRVEGWAAKPICDGISIDEKGNVYVSDIGAKAIGIINPKSKKYEQYIRHGDFLWPDGLCFGNDDRLYFYAAQLHLMPTFNAGRQASSQPFYLFKIKPLADGTVGR